LRSAGLFPPTMQAKVSVMLAAANPATARLLQDLGANTLNLPTDLDLAQIAAIRKAVDLPLDVYVEAPGELGGFIRLSRVADIIRVAAPVYVKLGLRNAPDIYPSGLHLESTAIQLSRERVRRARIALEIIERSGCQFVTSEIGASDLAIPIVTRDGTVGPSP
ncbi:MAG: U32 family peptidase, partial [Acidimicrobiales bacterium]